MKNCLHIKCDGSVTEVKIDMNNSLEPLQKLVGGYIEVVRHDGLEIICHEEALCVDKPTPNIAATALAGQMIYGDVVVLKEGWLQ